MLINEKCPGADTNGGRGGSLNHASQTTFAPPNRQACWVKLPTAVLERTDLTAVAKLVYASIANRIGGNGECWPGQRRIAKDCGCSPKAVNRAIRELADAGILVVDAGSFNGPRSNRTARYSLGPNVVESTTLAKGQRLPTDSPNVVESTTPTLSNRQQNKNKRTRSKEKTQAHTSEAAELIYSTYPRKVAKTTALRAIGKALAEIGKRDGVGDPAAWLLERVKAFASSDAGRAGKYTPYPATWFNAGRYDDEPSEWSRRREETGVGRIAAPPGKYARFRAGSEATR